MQFLKIVFRSGALQIWFLTHTLPEFTLSCLPCHQGLCNQPPPHPVVSDLGGTRHNCHLPALGSHSALLSLPGSPSHALAHSRCALSRQGLGGHNRAPGLRSCTIVGSLSSSPMVSFETRRVQATTAVQVDLLVWSTGDEDPRFWASRTWSYICPVKKARTPLCLPPALRAPRYPKTRAQVS